MAPSASTLAAALLCVALLASRGGAEQPPKLSLVANPASAAAGVRVTPRPYAGGADPAFRFVRVNGVQFTVADDNAPWYYIGANYWEGMSLGASGGGGNRTRLRADLDALVAAGVTQLRVLGAAEGPDSEPWRIVPSLQPCPGVYNADVLSGFDYLIAEMGARRMRATVVLGDEWAWSGGHVQYVRWAQQAAANNGSVPNASACNVWGLDSITGAPRQPDITSAAWRSRGFQDIPYPGPGGNSWSDYQNLAGQFYNLSIAQRLWRDHVTFMTSHVNPFTGMAHRDDPTIMSWQLANEPRAADPTSAESAAQYFAWLSDASQFVKAAAPHQLVSTGMEADTSYFSPAQSLLRTSNGTAVDFATAHLWVQNWGLYHPGYDDPAFMNATLPFARAYIAGSTAQAASLNKPLVLEEFGFPRDRGSLAAAATTTRRDAYFGAVFDTLLASASSAGALAGVNFWAFAGQGRPAARGVPGTRADLCGGEGLRTPSGDGNATPPVTLFGGPPDWAACFADQGSRQNTCGRDTWWAPREAWPPGAYIGQDVFLGDPPHESQGWYSTYNTDNTMDVIKAYTKQLNATLACAAAAVRTALDPRSAAGANAGTVACTAGIAPGRAGNLC